MFLWLPGIILIIAVLFVIMGELQPQLDFNRDFIIIKSVFGRKISIDTVKSASIIHKLPFNLSRSWGYLSGTSYKGKFYDNIENKSVWIYANHGNKKILKLEFIGGDEILIGEYDDSKYSDIFKRLISHLRSEGKFFTI